jgi:ribosomal protein S3
MLQLSPQRAARIFISADHNTGGVDLMTQNPELVLGGGGEFVDRLRHE